MFRIVMTFNEILAGIYDNCDDNEIDRFLLSKLY